VIGRKSATVTRPGGWYAVTIGCEPDRLQPPGWPEDLARLSREYDVKVTPAPGGRGTEVAVRSRTGAPRHRLRTIKQRLEAGEAVRVEGQPEGPRTRRGKRGIPLFKGLTRRGWR